MYFLYLAILNLHKNAIVNNEYNKKLIIASIDPRFCAIPGETLKRKLVIPIKGKVHEKKNSNAEHIQKDGSRSKLIDCFNWKSS
jgi:hypothetical protein